MKYTTFGIFCRKELTTWCSDGIHWKIKTMQEYPSGWESTDKLCISIYTHLFTLQNIKHNLQTNTAFLLISSWSHILSRPIHIDNLSTNAHITCCKLTINYDALSKQQCTQDQHMRKINRHHRHHCCQQHADRKSFTYAGPVQILHKTLWYAITWRLRHHRYYDLSGE